MKNLITNREPSYSSKRTRKTIDFCDIPTDSVVLDIGATNRLSQQLAEEKNVKVINTISDLDYDIIPAGQSTNDLFEYVTCFEVIEHLMNPKLFFDNLYNITTKSAKVYLSYPSRPKIMWNDEEHFHEYDSLRFNYLLKKTGWEIVKKKNIYVPRFPNGIRPLIRNFIPQTVIYELKKLKR